MKLKWTKRQSSAEQQEQCQPIFGNLKIHKGIAIMKLNRLMRQSSPEQEQQCQPTPS